MDLLNDASFVRWINGKANPREQLKWKQWEEESPSNLALKRKAHMLYSLPMEITDGADVEEQLAGLQKRIDKGRKIFRFPSENRYRSSGYRRAVAAAIVLLITIVGVLAFYNQQQPEETTAEPLYSTIEVGYGEKGTLKISDGSSIRLNSNSTLRYSPDQFNRSSVEVWLKGEAYFAIARNPADKKRTFTVHTPDGDVRVLGTRFNVNTRFQRTGVVLEEGSIEVLLSDSLQGIKGQFILKPGQRAQFSSNQADVYIQQVDTSLYTAWLDGKLAFEETPLKELIQNVEQTYGVSIKVEEPALLNESISGSLRDPDLKTLLKGMEKVLNINIQQKTEGVFFITKQHTFEKK